MAEERDKTAGQAAYEKAQRRERAADPLAREKTAGAAALDKLVDRKDPSLPPALSASEPGETHEAPARPRSPTETGQPSAAALGADPDDVAPQPPVTPTEPPVEAPRSDPGSAGADDPMPSGAAADGPDPRALLAGAVIALFVAVWWLRR